MDEWCGYRPSAIRPILSRDPWRRDRKRAEQRVIRKMNTASSIIVIPAPSTLPAASLRTGLRRDPCFREKQRRRALRHHGFRVAPGMTKVSSVATMSDARCRDDDLSDDQRQREGETIRPTPARSRAPAKYNRCGPTCFP
jgi:hypothetical protein